MVRPGFSLVELVIVVAIVAVIAAIAAPRLSNAAEDSRAASLKANLAAIRTAIDLYTAEHNGRPPNINKMGNADASSDKFIARLAGRTRVTGEISDAGAFGPYLTRFPTNPYKKIATIGIGEQPPGSGSKAWHYCPSTGRFSADDSSEHAAW